MLKQRFSIVNLRDLILALVRFWVPGLPRPLRSLPAGARLASPQQDDRQNDELDGVPT